jgi:UDP-glucose 4-epimerase
MRFLITGGAGFIGSHLASHLAARSAVRVLDNFRSGRRANVSHVPAELREGCVTDAASVAAALEGVDTVFHLAAMVSVEESLANPQECVRINVQGLLNVLEASAQAGVKRVVFCSSAAVYGNDPVIPKREDMTPHPLSPYAVTKLDGEYYCDLYRQVRGLSCVSLRFFNVFGPGQNPEGAYASAIPRFVRAALAGEPLRIFGDGEQTRDFVFVGDVVRALEFAGASANASGVYNVGYGRAWSVNELVRKIIALTGSTSPVEHLPARAGEVRHSLASCERLADAGFRLEDRREQGLAATIDSIRPRLQKETT